MMDEKLFETALGIAEPWHVVSVDLDAAAETLTVGTNFTPGSRLAVVGEPGAHPVHDTVSKRYRIQHECYLQVRVPRLKLPSGAVRQVEPDWAGKLSGFEALILMLAREMPFAAVARLTGESWQRVAAICQRYVNLARAWMYREQLREILDRKQTNVVSEIPWQWCTNIMPSKVDPMKEVAKMIRNHFEGIVAWAQTRQTNGFLEALNGLLQSAKRRARGYDRFGTIRTMIFLLAGKLDFSKLNPHVAR